MLSMPNSADIIRENDSKLQVTLQIFFNRNPLYREPSLGKHLRRSKTWRIAELG